ncbi:MAG: hypothetical protein FWD66_05130, partial [Paludibacter sp.]|nr:hypothetical protein [Paludibacter sp.]
MIFNKLHILIFGVLVTTNLNAQILPQYKYYFEAYSEIEKMLSGREKLDFKEAVFITENAYFENQLNKEVFDFIIKDYASICRGIIN